MMLVLTALLEVLLYVEVLPYVEELIRGLRHQRGPGKE
jgi:hypothetical protein